MWAFLDFSRDELRSLAADQAFGIGARNPPVVETGRAVDIFLIEDVNCMIVVVI